MATSDDAMSSAESTPNGGNSLGIPAAEFLVRSSLAQLCTLNCDLHLYTPTGGCRRVYEETRKRFRRCLGH